jgi:MSHA biogenesis protein MshM
MYLEHFNLTEFPFVLTPNTQYFCNLSSFHEALNVLLLSLRTGEGFIKITGEIGTGKTMLCRELLNRLGDEYVVAYLPNPPATSKDLHKVLAHELNIPTKNIKEHCELLKVINEKLLNICQSGKKVVIVIDEAQVISDKGLEGLRLLSNLETESKKLLHIVLFGQPELDKKLAKKVLRQLKQRILFSYRLRSITNKELPSYVYHRLAKAGNKYTDIFSRQAMQLLANAGQGIPRLINILCHKALISAYGKGKRSVGGKDMVIAIRDTDSIPWITRYLLINLTKFLILMVMLVLGTELFLLLRL